MVHGNMYMFSSWKADSQVMSLSTTALRRIHVYLGAYSTFDFSLLFCATEKHEYLGREDWRMRIESSTQYRRTREFASSSSKTELHIVLSLSQLTAQKSKIIADEVLLLGNLAQTCYSRSRPWHSNSVCENSKSVEKHPMKKDILQHHLCDRKKTLDHRGPCSFISFTVVGGWTANAACLTIMSRQAH